MSGGGCGGVQHHQKLAVITFSRRYLWLTYLFLAPKTKLQLFFKVDYVFIIHLTNLYHVDEGHLTFSGCPECIILSVTCQALI